MTSQDPREPYDLFYYKNNQQEYPQVKEVLFKVNKIYLIYYSAMTNLKNVLRHVIHLVRIDMKQNCWNSVD